MSTTGTKKQRNEWYNKWYSNPKNRAKHIKNSAINKKKARDRNRDFIRDYKRLHPCSICGENREHCLDFHHSVGSLKERCIATGVNLGWSIAHLKTEIKKCKILCKNCHADFHFKETGAKLD